MLKILVVASTENILNHKAEFVKSGISFDYLICEKNSYYDFGVFEQQKIFVEGLMLPIKENPNETMAQKNKKNWITDELSKLEALVFQNNKYLGIKNKFKTMIFEVPLLEKVWYIEEAIDLSLNKQNKKIHLEIKNNTIQEYDHIYMEDSIMASDSVQKLIQKAESSKNDFFEVVKTSDVFQFVGFEYKLNLQNKNDLVQNKFWSMHDKNYSSIYDNFYFTHANDNKVTVWSWIPVQQISNLQNSAYLFDRIQKRLKKLFDFLDFEKVDISFFKMPLSTHFELINKNEKMISFIPHFCFHSKTQSNQIIQAINSVTLEKLNIKKEFLNSNKIEGL